MSDISRYAALIADATRAAMLLQLLDGSAHTAGELARAANVSPQTASNHLAQLLNGQLVQVTSQGRHRYYRLAGSDIAQALENLLVLEHSCSKISSKVPAELRFARTCYDHIAGELGVQIMNKLLERRDLVYSQDQLVLTPTGEIWFTQLGIDLVALRRSKRAFMRPCLDWSERHMHLAGALGAALLTQFIALNWVARTDGRQLRVTVEGMLALEQSLNITFDQHKGSCMR